MDNRTDLLINISLQLPLLVLFVIYNERMLKRQDLIQEKRDKSFIDAITNLSERITDAIEAIHQHDAHVDERIEAAKHAADEQIRHTSSSSPGRK